MLATFFTPMSWVRRLGLAMLVLLGFALAVGSQEEASPQGVILGIDGAIGPATSDYLRRGFATARERGAPLVVLTIDTPGGLDVSMREIIREILNAPMPVAAYVHPSGARAASAGTFLLYASHVAAMSPATNVGAATPVSIGGGGGMPSPFGGEDDDEDEADEDAEDGDSPARAPASGDAMTAKVTNDAVAYIRSLAELRGRNPDWGERAVREGASLSASAALEENVIDLIAEDIGHLLREIDGREVKVGERMVTISTGGLTLEAIEPDWRNRLLSAITNPNIALILMLIGVYGLIFEFTNPGALLPGTVGSISLIVGLYALAALPLNFAGLALIGLGLALMVAEALTPTFGILGVGGVAAMGLGATILIDGSGTGFEVSPVLVLGLAAISLAFMLWIVRLAVGSYGRRVVTGREGLVGAHAEVLDWSGAEGFVRASGQRWRARARVPLRKGQAVAVTGIEGLTLDVAPEDNNEPRS